MTTSECRHLRHLAGGLTNVENIHRPFCSVLMLFDASCRHIYGETLGAWRTADLLIGLAYLARREPPGGGTLGDVAAAGRPYGMGLEGDAKEAAKVIPAQPSPALKHCPIQQAGQMRRPGRSLCHRHRHLCEHKWSFRHQEQLLLPTSVSGIMQSDLATLRHCMTFGLALRQQRPTSQLAIFRSQARIISSTSAARDHSCNRTLKMPASQLLHSGRSTKPLPVNLDVLLLQGFVEEDFLVVQQRSGLLKPSYFLLHDRAISSIVLLIRGTQTIKVPRS